MKSKSWYADSLSTNNNFINFSVIWDLRHSLLPSAKMNIQIFVTTILRMTGGISVRIWNKIKYNLLNRSQV